VSLRCLEAARSNELSSSPHTQQKDTSNMITFHPAARQTATGFIPMVTLRASKGRMVGSKVQQNGNVFETAQEALEHAVMAARRVVAQYPEMMRIASCVA
jgi:hypothetical protein